MSGRPDQILFYSLRVDTIVLRRCHCSSLSRHLPVAGISPFPSFAASLKVGHPPIVAPVPFAAPPKRLVLRPANLSRLWVLFPLKLGWRSLAHPGAQRPRRNIVEVYPLCLCLLGLGRLRCRRGDVSGGVEGGVGGDLDFVVGREGCFGGALEALEFGLLVGGESRRGGLVLEERGGCGAVEGRW